MRMACGVFVGIADFRLRRDGTLARCARRISIWLGRVGPDGSAHLLLSLPLFPRQLKLPFLRSVRITSDLLDQLDDGRVVVSRREQRQGGFLSDGLVTVGGCG